MAIGRLGVSAFCVFQLVFWALSSVTLVGMLGIFSQGEIEFGILAGRIATGALVTTALYFVYQHRYIRSLPLGWGVLSIILLNLVVALTASAFWLMMMRKGWPEIPSDSPFADFTWARIYSLLIWNVMYFGLELILDYHLVRIDAVSARVAAREAELKQLQAQISPHFLFNALNSVIADIEPGHRAGDMVRNIADYLRFTLREMPELEPLGRELDALETYFEMQRYRFGENLQCGIKVSPTARQVMVPPILIQPLLENAFKFGPLNSPLPFRVEVEALVIDGCLEIKVVNLGVWVPSGGVDSHGSGLSNLRRRLCLLVGEKATLEIDHGDGERVCVTIRIPTDPM